MRPFERTVTTGTVQGACEPTLLPVAEAFAANYTERGEVGASLCIRLHGRTVLDLWGGTADQESWRPWLEDTVSIVFSNTKAATALCLHLLADRGQVDLDAPVAAYWPEYAAAGKADTTLRMLLDHSAGLPALREPLTEGAAFDWDQMAGRLAAESPFWPPGSRNGYHGLTFGWLVGEVVRRVSGRSLGAFFAEEIAEPLGLDYWIGLPEAIEPRVAPIIPHRPARGAPANRFEAALEAEPDSVSSLYFLNTGGWRRGFNSRAGRAAEVPAANGVTNARGLAGFYAPLAAGGGGLLRPESVAALSEISSASHDDATLRIPTRFAAGFMRSMDNRGRRLDSVVLGPAAFGHVGAGGSLGFADPAHRLAFGYTMNRMGGGLLLNERGQGLVDAVYRCLANG